MLLKNEAFEKFKEKCKEKGDCPDDCCDVCQIAFEAGQQSKLITDCICDLEGSCYFSRQLNKAFKEIKTELENYRNEDKELEKTKGWVMIKDFGNELYSSISYMLDTDEKMLDLIQRYIEDLQDGYRIKIIKEKIKK